MQAFFGSLATYVLPFAAVITLIVTVHELGHFLTARAFGTAVDRFSIGFGRAIAKWRDRSGVEWRVGWLPLGGYVRFAGDENVASVPTRDDLDALREAIVAREGPGAETRYLPFKPLWQRTLIILAGPAANFVLAIALLSIVFGVFGEPIVRPMVAGVEPASPAARAGFQPGDRILTIDGHKTDSFEDVRDFVAYRAGKAIRFSIERRGTQITLTAVPDSVSVSTLMGGRQSVGYLGLSAQGGTVVHFGPLQAVARGASQTWELSRDTLFYLGRMVRGEVSAKQLGSVIGIAHASGKVTQMAVDQARGSGGNPFVAILSALIPLTALLSVSVGLLNLLPIPTLDGGFLLFYAYELVARKPPRAVVQAAGFRMGLAAILALFLFAAWNDLERLRVFAFVGNLFS